MSADNSDISNTTMRMEWPSCSFADKEMEEATVAMPRMSQMLALMQKLMAANNGRLPIICSPEFQWVEDLLKGLSFRYPVEDYFQQEELDMIFKAIDNNDYIHRVYPEAPPTCKGLLTDTGVFHAIARFKHNNENPRLDEIRWVCSAFSGPVPKHLYYLTFKADDGYTFEMSFASGTEILKVI